MGLKIINKTLKASHFQDPFVAVYDGSFALELSIKWRFRAKSRIIPTIKNK